MKRIEVIEKLNTSSRHNKFKILSQYGRDAMFRSVCKNYVTDRDWNIIIREMARHGKIKEEVLNAKN